MQEHDLVKQNWQLLVSEVEAAAKQAGRDPDSVRIVGVTKYVEPELALCLAQAGCHDLAENRPQLLWQKADHFQNCGSNLPVRWHMIGHLQRNKIRRTLPYNPLIHSVDSLRLLTAIADEGKQQDRVVDVLLEVNISGDETKTGLPANEIVRVLDERPTAGVNICGLMAMAGWGTDEDVAKRQFAGTRELRDRLETQCGVQLPELSMGMSGDFVAAIAAGATMVRIGSRLFEGIELPG